MRRVCCLAHGILRRVLGGTFCAFSCAFSFAFSCGAGGTDGDPFR